jgi:hypothetical protein
LEGHHEKNPAEKPPNKIHAPAALLFFPHISSHIYVEDDESYQHTTYTESVGLLLLD